MMRRSKLTEKQMEIQDRVLRVVEYFIQHECDYLEIAEVEHVSRTTIATDLEYRVGVYFPHLVVEVEEIRYQRRHVCYH